MVDRCECNGSSNDVHIHCIDLREIFAEKAIMDNALKSNWALILSFLFIMANSALIALEQYWFSLVPFALVLVILAFVAMDKLMWFIIFSTPLSLNLEELDFGGIGMFVPTEPLLFGILLIFFLKLLYERHFDERIIRHGMSKAIYFHLAWITVTVISSTMPLISIKFLLARLWFIVAFYFIASQLFTNMKNIRTFFWVYLIPLSIVALYTFIHHSQYGFAERPAHWVMQPFFKDHTVYGAVLAMIVSHFTIPIDGEALCKISLDHRYYDMYISAWYHFLLW